MKMRIRKPTDDEDLTYNDLLRRVKAAHWDIHKILFCISEWHQQRSYFFSLYRRLDVARAGRYDRNKDRESMKKALREWKEKHG